MATGLGVLGLAPEVFWRMTARELEAAVRGRIGPAAAEVPLARADLAGLMRRFPDA